MHAPNLQEKYSFQLKKSYSSCNVIRPWIVQNHLHYQISASRRPSCESTWNSHHCKKSLCTMQNVHRFVYIRRFGQLQFLRHSLPEQCNQHPQSTDLLGTAPWQLSPATNAYCAQSSESCDLMHNVTSINLMWKVHGHMAEERCSIIWKSLRK